MNADDSSARALQRGRAPSLPAWLPSRARRLLVFLAICLAASMLEAAVERYLNDQGSATAISRSLFDAKEIYQKVVSAWPRQLVPRYTVVLLIDPENDPTAKGLAKNVCAQRRYLAKLLPDVARYDPAVIVIDKYFHGNGCDSQEATSELQKVFAETAKKLPIVVGLLVDENSVQQGNDSRSGPSYLLESSVSFDGSIKEGIIHLDQDHRRLPLGWTVRWEPNGPAHFQETISLKTAKAYDSKLFDKYPDLKEAVEQRTVPFISQIHPSEFITLQAADFLCAGSKAGEPACAGRRTADSETQPNYVRGRIVVIGERGRNLDLHSTYFGPTTGVFLQADYIEALLDERYYRPLPEWWNYLFGFVFSLLVERSLESRSALTAVMKTAGLLLTAFLVLVLVARAGYYMNPVTLSAMILVAKLIDLGSKRFHHFLEARHER